MAQPPPPRNGEAAEELRKEASMFYRTEIQPYEAGLLYRNGRFVGLLGPGRHRVWFLFVRERVTRVDLRTRTVQVVGQEVTTLDRVSLRMNLLGRYRVVDAVKALHLVEDYPNHLYQDLQMALRSHVAGVALDALLANKGEAGLRVLEAVRPKALDYGVELSEAGVKDLVLPGEMRAILNQVVEAQKEAEASLIRRREETAATRSLANTAALLEKNPALARLKELEALERIARQGGHVKFVTGRE